MFDIFSDKLSFIIEKQEKEFDKARQELLVTYTDEQWRLSKKANNELRKLVVLRELVEYEKTKLNMLAMIFNKAEIINDLNSFCETVKQKMEENQSEST